MESLATGLKILSIFLFLLLLLGLYKPWIVLWWEESQYRLKAIKIYGLGAILCLLVSEIIISLFS